MKKGLIISALFFFMSCDPHDSRLTVVNNTQDTIFWIFDKSSELSGGTPVAYDDQKRILWNESSIVLPDSNDRSYMLGRDGWEYFINEECEDSTLRIFIFEKDVVIDNLWDSIVYNQIYSKRYSMTVDDLEKLDWEIIYDGRE